MTCLLTKLGLHFCHWHFSILETSKTTPSARHEQIRVLFNTRFFQLHDRQHHPADHGNAKKPPYCGVVATVSPAREIWRARHHFHSTESRGVVQRRHGGHSTSGPSFQSVFRWDTPLAPFFSECVQVSHSTSALLFRVCSGETLH